MQEELISFETAKLAKEKNFKEDCTHIYCKNTTCNHLMEPYKYSYKVNGNADIKDNLGYGITWSAPTQSLLQKWLREKHNLHLYITPLGDMDRYVSYSCFLYEPHEQCYNWHCGKEYEPIGVIKYCDTYEEALEAGLQEALKQI